MVILSSASLESSINEFLDREVVRLGIEFRLPAPIAFGSVYDPLWFKIKEVHPQIKHPLELLPSAKTVIVFALPLSLEAIRSNVYGDDPSRKWLEEYVIANKVIESVCFRLCIEIRSLGFKCFYIRPTHEFNEISLMSSWSHRHAGYVCGLGTFGINNMLITSKGCAVRLGSVITEVTTEYSSKPTYEYCLVKRGLKCGLCLSMCPINALSRWSSGKYLCYERLVSIGSRYRSVIGEFADACGKCCVGLPCSEKIP